jgi:NDP-sugar pyrophosphorylase family protein
LLLKKRKRSCKLARDIIIGGYSRIEDDVYIEGAIIGRNCVIGNDHVVAMLFF